MKRIIKKYHFFLFLPLVFLMIASCFCMYQATFIKDIYKWHLAKQILWFGVGFLLLFLLQKVKIRFFFQKSFYFYLLGIALLFLVLFLGSNINGAKAWFDFKIFHFQPSEFVKIALLLYLAKETYCFRLGNTKEFWYILKCFFIVLIPSILVFLEPDTGAIVFYLILFLSVLLTSGIRKRWFILGGFLFITLLFLFFYFYFYNQELLIKWIGTSFFYRMDRLIHFQNGSGMQLNNALITIGNAGLFGNGIKSSMLYVPELPTDFVFTLFLSVFGFCGGFFVLMCYFLITYYCITSIEKVKPIDFKIFVHGFFFLFLFQQIQNIFMNLGLLPIMGIPLPFLSYGGSNMVVYFIFLGILFSITKKEL